MLSCVIGGMTDSTRGRAAGMGKGVEGAGRAADYPGPLPRMPVRGLVQRTARRAFLAAYMARSASRSASSAVMPLGSTAITPTLAPA